MFKVGEVVWMKRCTDIPCEWIARSDLKKVLVKIVKGGSGYDYSVKFCAPYEDWISGTWGVNHCDLAPRIPGVDDYKTFNDLDFFPMEEEQ